MILNNDFTIVKCKINNNIGVALKLILEKLNLTQQDFLAGQIEKFVLEDINLAIKDSKN